MNYQAKPTQEVKEEDKEEDKKDDEHEGDIIDEYEKEQVKI